jgi:hypothetical protein
VLGAELKDQPIRLLFDRSDPRLQEAGDEAAHSAATIDNKVLLHAANFGDVEMRFIASPSVQTTVSAAREPRLEPP